MPSGSSSSRNSETQGFPCWDSIFSACAWKVSMVVCLRLAEGPWVWKILHLRGKFYGEVVNSIDGNLDMGLHLTAGKEGKCAFENHFSSNHILFITGLGIFSIYSIHLGQFCTDSSSGHWSSSLLFFLKIILTVLINFTFPSHKSQVMEVEIWMSISSLKYYFINIVNIVVFKHYIYLNTSN